MAGLVSDLLKPFKNLKDLLNALHIINNYSEYKLATIFEMIHKYVDSSITSFQLSELIIRNKAFPDLYGRDFFTENNIKKKCEFYFSNCVEFACTKTECEFCNSSLEGY